MHAGLATSAKQHTRCSCSCSKLPATPACQHTCTSPVQLDTVLLARTCCASRAWHGLTPGPQLRAVAAPRCAPQSRPAAPAPSALCSAGPWSSSACCPGPAAGPAPMRQCRCCHWATRWCPGHASCRQPSHLHGGARHATDRLFCQQRRSGRRSEGQAWGEPSQAGGAATVTLTGAELPQRHRAAGATAGSAIWPRRTLVVGCPVCAVVQHTVRAVALAMLPQALIYDAAAVGNGQAAVAMPAAVQDLSIVRGALPGVRLRRHGRRG